MQKTQYKNLASSGNGGYQNNNNKKAEKGNQYYFPASYAWEKESLNIPSIPTNFKFFGRFNFSPMLTLLSSPHYELNNLEHEKIQNFPFPSILAPQNHANCKYSTVSHTHICAKNRD